MICAGQSAAQIRIDEHRLLADHQRTGIDPAQCLGKMGLGLFVCNGDQIIRGGLCLHVCLLKRPEPGIDDRLCDLLDQFQDGCGVHMLTLAKVKVILCDEIDQQLHALVQLRFEITPRPDPREHRLPGTGNVSLIGMW